MMGFLRCGGITTTIASIELTPVGFRLVGHPTFPGKCDVSEPLEVLTPDGQVVFVSTEIISIKTGYLDTVDLTYTLTVRTLFVADGEVAPR